MNIQMTNRLLTALLIVCTLYSLTTFNSGCAQIGAPTGGKIDSLAPFLVRANPELKTINFKGNKITLNFNEYVEVADAQNNVLVSPLPKSNPSINYNLKTVTIRLRDTLEPNTTYAINFGNAIKDVNEGNVFQNFTYVFSTGNTIDSATLQGKLLLAETGLTDSTIVVALYRDADDSAVQKRRPNYLARIKSDGIFRFTNLPEDNFKIYALKDGDGNKFYSSKTELFAFHDTVIKATVNDTSQQLTLFAYSEEKGKDTKITPVLKPKPEKLLKISSKLSGKQDLLTSLELGFNNPLKVFDTARISLTDSNYNRIAGAVATLDSTAKKIIYTTVWKPGETYILIIPNDAVADSADNKLAKNDTLRFDAKNEADYGRVILRFKNYDQLKNPVLQLVAGDEIKYAFPLTGPEFVYKRLLPGEYSIRILNDDNKDGRWTPGNYSKKISPEKAITLPQKLGVRADWDNERDVALE
ncbi:MAG: Ig-like domain-containing protein [Rhizobacter sp.]|nr:Ig-like domain-containing protein [Ferruginibacter sp.]